MTAFVCSNETHHLGICGGVKKVLDNITELLKQKLVSFKATMFGEVRNVILNG